MYFRIHGFSSSQENIAILIMTLQVVILHK